MALPFLLNIHIVYEPIRSDDIASAIIPQNS
jgi:hypothetical protein